MSHALHHHIVVGDKPLCDFTGCQAGRDIQAKAADTLNADLEDRIETIAGIISSIEYGGNTGTRESAPAALARYGRELEALKAQRVHASDITCGHSSGVNARKIAAALRPHFRRGRVKVIAGNCPDSI